MDGILVVNKPQGMTSHDVVDLIRRRFRLKKVGHAGTLDPMATGVLVVLIGSFTKLSAQFMSEEKEYKGSLILGASSDTDDAWGKITASGKSTDFTTEEITAAFKNFLGELPEAPDHPLTIMFSIGGAGAQKEIGIAVLKNLKKKIKSGEVKMIFSAGTREEIKNYLLVIY